MSMKLRSFRAGSMPQVLALVKREMGPHAVIVQTRTLRQGGVLGFGKRSIVEITARPANGPTPTPKPQSRSTSGGRLARMYAQSKPQIPQRDSAPLGGRLPAPPSTPPHRTDATLAGDDLKGEIGHLKELVQKLVKGQRRLHAPNMSEPLFEMYLTLIQREVADELARELIDRVQHDLTGNQLGSPHLVCQKLVEVMEGLIKTTGPVANNISSKPRTVALIGPTGVGKTTTIAKLAANFKLRQNKKVGLITIDTYRIGAVDQLRMYAQIIDVPLKVVLTPAELKEAILLMQDMDVIFIDTAGRSQNDEIKIKELQTFLQAAQPDEVHLVLSTTGHHSNMVSAAEKFNELGANRVIFTKLDEAISFGVILSVLRKVNASLSYVTTGQDVPDDIEVGDPHKLASLLLSGQTSRMQTPTQMETLTL